MPIFEYNAGTVSVDNCDVDMTIMINEQGDILADYGKKGTCERVYVAIPLRCLL